MTARRASVIAAALLFLAGCGAPPAGPRPQGWSTGFWFWGGEQRGESPVGPVDVIYFHAGDIAYESYGDRFFKQPWRANGRIPEWLPPAREYWAVFRYRAPTDTLSGKPIPLPAREVIPLLTRALGELREAARRRGLPLGGIQLDVDSPTRLLPEYAAFLREVKKVLPPEVPLSITALLDWFRDGTAVAEVIGAVDEFVPQFYDVDAHGKGISAKLEAAKWGPVLNRYRKRFRLGISSFGRAGSAPLPGGNPGSRRVAEFPDLSPALLEQLGGARREVSHSEAGDLTLTYRVEREVRQGWRRMVPGEGYQFVLATPEGIGAAVAEARKIGDYNAGVLFFRWPYANETLTAQPDEVLAAAGVAGIQVPQGPRIRVNDGGCAAVYCVELFLVNLPRLAPEPRRYRIESPADFEYFVAGEGSPARPAGAARLEVALGAYPGRTWIYLGRLVLRERAELRIEAVP